MASFTNKLNQNDLYPRVPIRGAGEIDIGRIRRMQQERLMPPPMMQAPQSSYQPRDFLRNPMDVAFKPPVTDRIPQKTLGVDPNDPTGYQQGQLALRAAELAMRQQQYGNANELAGGRLANSQRMTDIQAFRAQNPNARIVTQKGGNMVAINPQTGQTIRDFGPSGEMTDEATMAGEQSNAMDRISATAQQQQALEGQRQQGRESLQVPNLQNARDIAEFQANSRPSGSTTIRSFKDDQGRPIYTSTSETKQVAPPQSSMGKLLIPMYGPGGETDENGQPFMVPPDKVADARSKGMTSFKSPKIAVAH